MIDGQVAFWAGHVCLKSTHGVSLAMALVARYPWQIEQHIWAGCNNLEAFVSLLALD